MVLCYIYNDCILYFIGNGAPASRAVSAAAPRAAAPNRSVRRISTATEPREGDKSRAKEDGDSSGSDVVASSTSTQHASRSLSPARAAATSTRNPREDENSNQANHKGH